jgi:hypothetical protein
VVGTPKSFGIQESMRELKFAAERASASDVMVVVEVLLGLGTEAMSVVFWVVFV